LDIRQVFNHDGTMRHPAELPADVAPAVKRMRQFSSARRRMQSVDMHDKTGPRLLGNVGIAAPVSPKRQQLSTAITIKAAIERLWRIGNADLRCLGR
jgi:hypothetical protein